MPYIKQERRKYLDKKYGTPTWLSFFGDDDLQVGDIAHLLFKMFLNMKPKFSDYAGLMGRIVKAQESPLLPTLRRGEIECAKMEIYRRIISRYENECIRRNGDIECDT